MARRCGYCGMGGHNRRTCNALSPEMKVRQQSKNLNIHRTCGYCGVAGHNRTTCEKAVNDYFIKIDDTKKFRKNFIEDMKSHGLGIGALIKTSYDAVYFIESIDWNSMVENINGCRILRCSVFGADPSHRGYRIAAPRWFGLRKFDDFFTLDRMKEMERVDILSPISAQDVENQIPSDFLVGDNYMDNLKQRYSFAKKRIEKSGRKI